MMAYYLAKFILQIWKYLKNAHLFTCILLISMFLSAHAKWILLWIITLSQNIGETCSEGEVHVMLLEVGQASHVVLTKSESRNYQRQTQFE